MGIQINGQTDTISATDGSFTISGASGNLTGNLTGDVTGNLTGDVTGNLTGNVTSSGISTFSDTVNVGAGKSIRLYGATSGYSEIIAAAGSASTTFTLPANGGSVSQYLQTDGAGVLSWVTPAAGLTWNTLADNVSVGNGGAKTISGIDSNAIKVIMTFKNVSLSTSDNIYHMVGSGALNGAYQTGGGFYGTSSFANVAVNTSYFQFFGLGGASETFHGIIEYTYHGDNEWYCVSHTNYGSAYMGSSTGKADLSGTLDRIGLGGLGASVFDAGQLSVFELV